MFGHLAADEVQCGVYFIDNNNGWLAECESQYGEVCLSPEAEKGSGLATGTKVDLLLAFLAHAAGHHSSLGHLGTSARFSKDRISRTRPAPTIRAAAALQRLLPRLCLYIGTYWHILHLVFVHPLLLLMLVLSVSASRHSFHPTFSAQPPYPCALFLLRINNSALNRSKDLEPWMSPNP